MAGNHVQTFSDREWDRVWIGANIATMVAGGSRCRANWSANAARLLSCTTRSDRDSMPVVVKEALARIAEACRSGENLMEPICEAVRHDATVGEVSDIFRTEFGVYTDPGWI